MTALYFERYLNFGLTKHELNVRAADHRHRPVRASICRPATGIICSSPSACARASGTGGGIALEFPTHPIQETGKRPTAALDRNLSYLGLVEVLFGYPLDGVVLTTGCDKTTPASHHGGRRREHLRRSCSRAGRCSTAGGKGERAGSGTIKWAMSKKAGGGRDRLQGIYRCGRRLCSLHRPLQHHGHRLDHERAGGSAGAVAAGLRRHTGALSRARPNCVRDRPPRGGDRAGGPQALRHPHARGVRERHRGLLGDRRLDQCADPHQCHRAPCRDRALHR